MRKKNPAASVRQRLLDLSKTTGEDFQLVLTRYAVERFLYRLGESEHKTDFVLKGAMLFALWTGEMHRPTRDLDLLGFGADDEARLASVFRSLCEAEFPDDGLAFASATIAVEPIREDREYSGKRVTIEVRLGQALVHLQVDVGFGDAITPGSKSVEFPTLLGMDPPRLRAYPRETVVAEKLEAMVKLGLANSRMKDFYDLIVLSRRFGFDGQRLCDAITATFKRRGTPLPAEVPVALTPTFSEDDSKKKQWKAFVRRSGLEERAGELPELIAELATFALPLFETASRKEKFRSEWPAKGPWTS
jgi:predicted nucleotidyltransferase component of viral defense system